MTGTKYNDNAIVSGERSDTFEMVRSSSARPEMNKVLFSDTAVVLTVNETARDNCEPDSPSREAIRFTCLLPINDRVGSSEVDVARGMPTRDRVIVNNASKTGKKNKNKSSQSRAINPVTVRLL